MSERLPIVDAHHHLWDRTHLRYPWLEEHPEEPFFLGDPALLPRQFFPADYRAATDLHEVVKTVHVEAECDRRCQVEETRWLTEMNARFGLPNVWRK